MTTAIGNIQASIQALLEVDAVTNISEETSGGKTSKIGDKIRPDAMRQNDVPPFILIEAPEDQALNDLKGYSGQMQGTIQVTCVAQKSRAKAAEIANAVNLILNNFKGVSAGITIQHLIQTGPMRGYEPPQDDGDQSHGFYVTINYAVLYKTSV